MGGNNTVAEKGHPFPYFDFFISILPFLHFHTSNSSFPFLHFLTSNSSFPYFQFFISISSFPYFHFFISILPISSFPFLHFLTSISSFSYFAIFNSFLHLDPCTPFQALVNPLPPQPPPSLVPHTQLEDLATNTLCCLFR